MHVIPAIDLWDGKVVRLLRGDPTHSTVYSQKPVEVAKQWNRCGAELVHVVDLSAAFGQGDNSEVIKQIIKEVDVKIEIGGGIREIAKAEEWIRFGAARVVIGTKGMDGEFLERVIASLGSDKVAVSVDVVDSFFAIEGWQKKTQFTTEEVVTFLYKKGIKWIIYTDISRDGTLKGPNREAMRKWQKFKDIHFISSGGISSLEDFKIIKKELPFVWGVIVGKALYENKVDLIEAIAVCSE